jgi:type II secretory pathway pseudopilin PulG
MSGPDRAADGGETLIELLVAMVVIGIAVVGILGALSLAAGASSAAKGQARGRAVLASWAESLSAVADTGGYRYTACASAGTFPAPAGLPTGYGAAVSAVRYWNGTAWSATCGTDQGLQRLTLTVTSPAGLLPGTSQTLDVVVRRPCALASSDPAAC